MISSGIAEFGYILNLRYTKESERDLGNNAQLDIPVVVLVNKVLF